MSSPAGITEYDLHAFVDGELDFDTRAVVQAWLDEHPDDAARVRDWQQQMTQLHEVFDGVLNEAVPVFLSATLARPRPSNVLRTWMSTAAAICVFALGIGVGWFLRAELVPDDANNLVDRAVSAHVVYVGERRHAVEVWAKEEDHLVTWLSKRLKHPIKLPNLVETGFQLVGGRLVADGGTPAAQFMYENAAGRRVTLYTRRSRQDGDTSFHFIELGGASAYYWYGGPLTFAVVGDMERQELIKIARLIFSSMGS